MNKYKVGSVGVGVSNNRDKDYVVISNEVDYKRTFDKETKEEIIYISEETLKNNLKFKGNFHHQLYNYQYDREIIGEDFPIEYHILDYKKELLEYLKTIVENKSFNMNTRITAKGCCTKPVYHVAYNYFILKNNSPILTDEQFTIINMIHDGEMPISYINELSNNILKANVAEGE